jgi:hypothetical protein
VKGTTAVGVGTAQAQRRRESTRPGDRRDTSARRAPVS